MSVSREVARAAVSETDATDATKDQAILAAEGREVEIGGRKRFFALRTKWSWVIIGWITILILFNCVLAIMVGAGALNFANYQWFITAVTVETFLQVIALGAIAVRFLFSSGDTPPSV